MVEVTHKHIFLLFLIYLDGRCGSETVFPSEVVSFGDAWVRRHIWGQSKSALSRRAIGSRGSSDGVGWAPCGEPAMSCSAGTWRSRSFSGRPTSATRSERPRAVARSG